MNGRDLARSDRVSKLISRLSAGASLDRSQAFLVKAPLRICPLGAHVDHQGGTVTGMTVDREVLMAVVPGNDAVARLTSLEFPGEVVVDLDDPAPTKAGDWGDYVRAAVAVLSGGHCLRRGFQAALSV